MRLSSVANIWSKSYNSSAGDGKSCIEGGNTAGFNGGIGVSKLGGINVNGSCFRSKSFYNSIDLGTLKELNSNNLSLNILVKSMGNSSLSCRHALIDSLSVPMSGTDLNSVSASSAL